jgi:hypothetical protein
VLWPPEERQGVELKCNSTRWLLLSRQQIRCEESQTKSSLSPETCTHAPSRRLKHLLRFNPNLHARPTRWERHAPLPPSRLPLGPEKTASRINKYTAAAQNLTLCSGHSVEEFPPSVWFGVDRAGPNPRLGQDWHPATHSPRKITKKLQNFTLPFQQSYC